jgi:N-acetylmuramoyl-L-alanine amidase
MPKGVMPMRYKLAWLLVLLPSVSLAAPVQIQNIRIWPAPDNTRIVFDLSAPTVYQVSSFADRIEIVIDEVQLSGIVPGFDTGKSLMTTFSSAVTPTGVHVVLALKDGVQTKSFTLKPNEQYGHRLVVDLFREKSPGASASDSVVLPAEAEPAVVGPPPRNVVIAIDPGHGGEDPGAHGQKGVVEKDVVLAIARKLETLLKREKGMQPVLIRDGDYYVSLRQRINKARVEKADLFISIHADAFYNPDAKGSSVYTLSQRGATNEAARWLADQENAADLVGGVSLDDKDELLASVLLDLSQTATTEASLDVGSTVLTALKQIGSVHKHRVEQAGFLVLKSPDIPSILVETAFISNPAEEKRLRDPAHQEKLAVAIMEGIRAYFIRHAPPGTILAQLDQPRYEHVVAFGETLSGIAKQYRVSMDSLRAVNSNLSGEMIRVGEVLRLPGNDS